MDANAEKPHGKGADAQSTPETDVLDTAGERHALVRKFRLDVTAGLDAGASFESAEDRLTIGTSRAADVVLSDTTVSRFHCELSVSASQVRIRDLGSRNGTLINGVPVLDGYLVDGCTVLMGRTHLAFTIGQEHAKLPISERESFGEMVGRSVAMRRVFSVLERAAQTDATVLLQGETGTGKDLAAESVHASSARADGPFVVVDCGALPPSLLESELFGHERGAFTGADRARAGAFESASGGTLFLDEIGELPLDLQPKLLRVLESRDVQRLGGDRRTPLNVRIIAATNRNLRSEVNARRFRSDLYYRLAVIEVTLPALREHAADLPLLVEGILDRLGAGDDPASNELRAPAFLAELGAHPWPGNVRELRNYLERCVAMQRTMPVVAPDQTDGLPTIDPGEPLRPARERWLDHFERRYLEALLAAHDGNVTAAARAAGVARVHLYRLLDRRRVRRS